MRTPLKNLQVLENVQVSSLASGNSEQITCKFESSISLSKYPIRLLATLSRECIPMGSAQGSLGWDPVQLSETLIREHFLPYNLRWWPTRPTRDIERKCQQFKDCLEAEYSGLRILYGLVVFQRLDSLVLNLLKVGHKDRLADYEHWLWV